MPYGIKKQDGKQCVFKFSEDGEPTGESLGCHDSRAEAERQVSALYAAEKKAVGEMRGWIDQALDAAGKALGLKAGARHSKADQEMLQQVHDNAVHLGAMCEKARKQGSALMVLKASDGEYWAVGVMTNKYKDQDEEIIIDAAHKEFAAWLDAHPEQAPEFWSWHTPQTARKNRAGWWDYSSGGFIWMAWPLTKEEAARFKPGEELAMSHGFFARKQGKYITFYRTFEGSELRPGAASNPWTDLTVMEVDMAFTPEKRDFLVERFGEEAVTQWEQSEATQAKALKEAGVEFKEQATPAEQPDPGAFAEAVAKALNLEGLNGVIVSLDTQVKALAATVEKQAATIQAQAAEITELKKSDDEKVAQALSPRVVPMAWGARPSEAKETKVDDDDPVVKAMGAGVSWVQQIGRLA